MADEDVKAAVAFVEAHPVLQGPEPWTVEEVDGVATFRDGNGHVRAVMNAEDYHDILAWKKAKKL